MKGTIISIDEMGIRTISKIDGPPELEALKAAIGGGFLEVVPRFARFFHEGKWQRCIAFCDEDGKSSKNLPVNATATRLWAQAMQCSVQMILASGDVLVGKIAIVMGDDEFMGAL